MNSLADLPPGPWTIDPAHTSVAFEARHLIVAGVRGTFSQVAAQVEIGARSADSRVTATVQLTSVDTGAADRDARLRSAEFFDVRHHPEMTFRSTQVGDSTLRGDLTIRGVTRPVVFDLELTGIDSDDRGNTTAGFEARAVLKRTDWGLDGDVAPGGGGALVGNRVKIILDVLLRKAG